MIAARPSDPANLWAGLDPLTRLVIAGGTVVAAALLESIGCLLLLLLVAVVLPATVAGQVRRVFVTSLLLALPLLLSVVIVNLLFAVGTPEQGLRLAAQVVTRVLAMAGAAVLFYATTPPGELIASLQSHGLPPRVTFVIHNAVAMIPRLARRASDVAAAQRARGLDTEGSWWRRARGVLALAGPTVLGAIDEVETRTMALESRGFGHPGRPTSLWLPRDGPGQRLARWGVVAALLLLVLVRAVGIDLPC